MYYLRCTQACNTREYTSAYSTAQRILSPYHSCVFLVFTHVTWRPCWWSMQFTIFTLIIMHLVYPPPPKSLHDHCSQFLLGITVVPREIQDNGYEKFGGGGNRVRDGPCENGKEKLFQRSYIKTEFRSQRIETFLFLITNMAAMTSRVNQKL